MQPYLCIVLKIVKRTFWIEKIVETWQKRSVVWLSYVHRSGKTCLSLSLRDIGYFGCELPWVRRMLEDIGSFLAEIRRKRTIVNKLHRLRSLSQILKIVANHIPDTKIQAISSLILGRSTKFRDTHVGRNAEVCLTTMILADLEYFGQVKKEVCPHFSLMEEIRCVISRNAYMCFWQKIIKNSLGLGIGTFSYDLWNYS